MRRIRWWWFYGRRELRRVVVCGTVGHRIAWRESTAWDIDAFRFTARCMRCHRIWPNVVMFTHTMAVKNPRSFDWQGILDAKAEELKFARTMSRVEERRMADLMFAGDDE